jgi:hypothetical protein
MMYLVAASTYQSRPNGSTSEIRSTPRFIGRSPFDSENTFPNEPPNTDEQPAAANIHDDTQDARQETLLCYHDDNGCAESKGERYTQERGNRPEFRGLADTLIAQAASNQMRRS